MTVKMLQQPFAGGFWLIREDHNQEYDRLSLLIDNSAGGTPVVLAGGAPVKAQAAGLGSLGLAADVNAASATIIGAVLEPCTIPAGEKRMVACAARGFNVIDQNFLPTSDYAGTAYTAATTLGDLYVTNLKWVKRIETTTQLEQAT